VGSAWAESVRSSGGVWHAGSGIGTVDGTSRGPGQGLSGGASGAGSGCGGEKRADGKTGARRGPGARARRGSRHDAVARSITGQSGQGRPGWHLAHRRGGLIASHPPASGGPSGVRAPAGASSSPRGWRCAARTTGARGRWMTARLRCPSSTSSDGGPMRGAPSAAQDGAPRREGAVHRPRKSANPRIDGPGVAPRMTRV